MAVLAEHAGVVGFHLLLKAAIFRLCVTSQKDEADLVNAAQPTIEV